MSPFEPDNGKPTNSPGDAQPDASAPAVSNADADDSAAHIAELVRRTAERQGEPGPSFGARPDMDPPRPPVPAPSVHHPVTHPAANPHPQPVAAPVRPGTRRPSRRTLVAAGFIAVLVGLGVALSNPFGVQTPTAATKPPIAAPVRYTVKVTDSITDCADHARGQAKDSFEKQNCLKATRYLATGDVNGRAALFVASRIEMASAEAAASVKQVLDDSGTGNLNDLLREGMTFPGAPDKMPDSGYVSVQTGKVVTVAEAGFVDGGRSTSIDPALRAAAAQVAAVVSAQS